VFVSNSIIDPKTLAHLVVCIVQFSKIYSLASFSLEKSATYS